MLLLIPLLQIRDLIHIHGCAFHYFERSVVGLLFLIQNANPIWEVLRRLQYWAVHAHVGRNDNFFITMNDYLKVASNIRRISVISHEQTISLIFLKIQILISCDLPLSTDDGCIPYHRLFTFLNCGLRSKHICTVELLQLLVTLNSRRLPMLHWRFQAIFRYL